MGRTDTRISSENPSSHASPLSRAGVPAAPNGKPALVRETQGAMTEQSSDAAHGHESVPQKLPQLVGCREPQARSHPSKRPAPNGTG